MITIPQILEEPLADLGLLIKALGPYRKQAVLTGGMVPIIYRHLDSAEPVLQEPLATYDLDVTLPGRFRQTSPNLATLLSESDFNEQLRGSSHPPSTVFRHIRHGDDMGSVYVEFLSPLI